MHPTQLEILDSLRQTDSKQFNDLLRDVAETSDNLTYHLKQLLKLEFVESPSKGKYKLAQKGIVYLNNNLELSNHLFPTVSCMLYLTGPKNQVLLMKKLKQPFLDSLHLPTFGVISASPVSSQVNDFLRLYQIDAEGVEFRSVHRERTRVHTDLIIFDKFFLVFTGHYAYFQQEIKDRQFLSMAIDDVLASDYTLPATKTVVTQSKDFMFSEALRDEKTD